MYYQLTYLSSPDRKRIGDSVLCGHKALTIGQSPSCDVRLPEVSTHEPVISAAITPSSDQDGWIIVRRNDAQDIKVGGEPLAIACPLSSGDEISISDGESSTRLRFTVHNDGNYDPALGIVHNQRHGRSTHLIAIAAAILAIGAAIIGLVASRGGNDLRHIDLEPFHSSIYHITTDSVYLKVDSVINGEACQAVVDAIELSEVAQGTCFLTDKGLFVTARHCIEPWLDDDQWDGVTLNDDVRPEVALAARAETANRLSGNTRYHLISHCVISNGIERYEFSSSDFAMDKSRDQVVCLGTNTSPIYWRTIFPIANRRDMELGDAAYVASDGLVGDIMLASLKELEQFDKQADKDIAILGFPLNDNDVQGVISHSYGNSQHLEFDADGTMLGCIQMIASINPGNSGGPVLALIDGKVRAIGIVSKADGRATQGTFWAVPVTVVNDLFTNGGPDQEAPVYRR